MLTRLKVNGFKNLVDIDLYFGPFTCIVGGNGVGKSNLFDAIQFLSLLADKPFVDAANLLRTKNGESNRTSNIRSIFHHSGENYLNQLSFEVEMLIPKSGEDDLGQPAKATFNFLKYTLILGLDESDELNKGPIKILKEELKPINKGEANKHLLFKHPSKWRKELIEGRRTVNFISTINENDSILINLHQDGGSKGKPKPFLAKNLPRTILSTASYASETPTILLARREMQSWRLLQLEPSSLRNPDELDQFSYRSRIASDGSHLAATIYRLAKYNNNNKAHALDEAIYTQLANRLSELIKDVKRIEIDKDEKRQLLSLQLINKDGTKLSALSLSDGTLRFLALAVLDLDYTESGLICLEEPENGIHPERIPAIIELLQSIPVDPSEENGDYDSLRQVIINTHSPKVVLQVPDDSLVYVEVKEVIKNGKKLNAASISALSDTWRTEKANTKTISKGKLLAYLNPHDNSIDWLINQNDKLTKVKDRPDLQALQQPNLFD